MTIGVVVIGRNEGERLVRCLASLRDEPVRIVYVDSASTDRSVAAAEAAGAEVVALDPERPFTAARARNAGLSRLRELGDPEYVQLVDGDCEIQPGWLAAASAHLDAHPDVAVVCGRRRERHPEASLYNRIIDLEWDTPIGEASACGGDAMVRARALAEVGGYDESLIAGEEPELCLRLARRGHRIDRIDREMTLHDAAITRLSEWWRRLVRAGHACAESAWLHGAGPERFRVREVASIVAWGGVLPLFVLALAPATGGRSALVAIAAYALLWWRVRRTRTGADAGWWAASCVLSKWAGLQGVCAFLWNRVLRGRRTRLIEYKRDTSRSDGSAAPQ